MRPFEKYPTVCREIVNLGRELYQKGFLAACDGNISIRVEDEIWCTPTGVPKKYLKPEQICSFDINDKQIYGRPSSERKMHLAVYQTCPTARAVVHAHPPHAIAWSVFAPNLKELPGRSLSELILAAGSIPFVPYARPGTAEMGEVLKPYLHDHKLMILRRHGALAWGDNLMEADIGMDRLEHTAEILHKARCLGELSELPEDEVKALVTMRGQIGNKTL